MMRPLAPVRVRCDYRPAQPGLSMELVGNRFQYVRVPAHSDWVATCRVCGEHATFGVHRGAVVWAHGHMHVRHPGWHDGPTVTLEQSIPDVWRTYVDPFWDREHP